jgi:hypothetical protein
MVRKILAALEEDILSLDLLAALRTHVMKREVGNIEK